jgi:N6-adenosine-specific RNA methylase IME4
VKTLAGAECITLAGEGLHLGTGLSGPRANTEVCLLAKRGEPRRLAADVDQVIVAPAGGHSEKPNEVYKRIERLFPGPYLELFARELRQHWTVWGDEIPRGSMTAPNDEAPKPSAGSTQAVTAPDPLSDIPEFLWRASAAKAI